MYCFGSWQDWGVLRNAFPVLWYSTTVTDMTFCQVLGLLCVSVGKGAWAHFIMSTAGLLLLSPDLMCCEKEDWFSITRPHLHGRTIYWEARFKFLREENRAVNPYLMFKQAVSLLGLESSFYYPRLTAAVRESVSTAGLFEVFLLPSCEPSKINERRATEQCSWNWTCCFHFPECFKGWTITEWGWEIFVGSPSPSDSMQHQLHPVKQGRYLSNVFLKAFHLYSVTFLGSLFWCSAALTREKVGGFFR